MRWSVLVAIGAIAFGIAGIIAVILGIDLSARRQPGRVEEYIRTRVTRGAIRRRAAREEIPPPPSNRYTSMSLAAGKSAYDSDCASCHGSDGQTPTAIGRGMSPPAVPLDSKSMQSYSDRELFAIVHDGVRFTGMPAFAGLETNDQIWDVVDYLRLLRSADSR
ncbi:MAG TPA: cytochrome c [Candidatus Acidoferrales bacterium]|jgi:mono/diheme cytochrome c family protein|nr:cytochrome c [Candidatus Acidoferrales bacterium]